MLAQESHIVVPQVLSDHLRIAEFETRFGTRSCENAATRVALLRHVPNLWRFHERRHRRELVRGERGCSHLLQRARRRVRAARAVDPRFRQRTDKDIGPISIPSKPEHYPVETRSGIWTSANLANVT